MSRPLWPLKAATSAARDVPRIEHLTAKAIATGGTVFVFPGHAAQPTGGTVASVDSTAAFRAQLRLCDAAFAEFADWPLLGTVLGEADCPMPDRADVAPSVLFAVVVSLAAQWRAMGIHPDAVIGHSQGEVAAAYVAGALSLRDAARVVTRCGKVISAMSGTDSADMDTLRETLRESLSGIQPRAGDIPYISSVTGAGLDSTILDADYWFANLRQPVLFEEAVRWSCERGYRTFIECSPNPLLNDVIQETLRETAI